MPVLQGSITDVGGATVNQSGYIDIRARHPRQNEDGTKTVGTGLHRITVTNGVLEEKTIDPGAVTVTVAVGDYYDTFSSTVPEEGPVDFWVLREQTAQYEPTIVNEVRQLASQVEGLATAQDEAVADLVAGASATKAVLNATYAPSFPTTTTITYDGDNVDTVTENGITTTFTYNPDGSVATDTRLGVTRTYTYDGSGNLTWIAS